jgi:hypothetical protein
MVYIGVGTDPADRALERLGVASPGPAARAREALDVVLARVRRSCWPEVAWRFSRLTASGCPVELSFSSADPAVRYTAEVAGPEFGNEERLRLTQEVLRGLTPNAEVPPRLWQSLQAVQRGRELNWGAWLGGRHDEQGSRFKLYAEVPREAGDEVGRLTADLLGPEALLAHRRPRMEGIGYEPWSGRLELYYRVGGLDVWETGSLLLQGDFAARQGDLLDLLEVVFGRAVRPRLPLNRFGYSLTFDRSGRMAVCSLFCYAIDVFGVDSHARRRVLELSEAQGWVLKGYREVSQPLERADRLPTYHTVVAFSVMAAGPPVLTIGLVPPDA